MIIFTNACVSSKKWTEDKYLLKKQSMKGYKNMKYEKLYPLFRQKPNRKVNLGFTQIYPYVGIYNFGKKFFNPEKVACKISSTEKKYDKKIRKAEENLKPNKSKRILRRKKKKIKSLKTKSKKGNWLMRVVGEPPIFYDSTATKLTKEAIEKKMKTNGFFQSKVDIRLDTSRNKRISVTYEITENQPTYIGNIHYTTSQDYIDSLLQKNKVQSKIKLGDFYDESKISSERQRIETLLRNNGYPFFNRQYVSVSVDTNHFEALSIENTDTLKLKTKLPKREADIEVIINEPKKGEHQYYKLDDVYFYIINNQKKGKIDTLESQKTGIKYIHRGKRSRFSYRILDRRIKIKPKDEYSLFHTQETQRSLGILDMFKFVNIKRDTLDGKLDMEIDVSPLDKYQLTDEIGLNVTQGLPGPFVSVSLKNRNTFGGMEIFENSFRFTIDGQTGFSTEDNFYSSQEISFNSSLKFPQILFPTKLRFAFDNYNPTTKLNLGYNFVNRPEYTRTNLSASIAYNGQIKFSSYQLTLAELSIVNTTRISDGFQELLDDLSSQGNPIINSFRQALISSIYFTYTFNNNTGNESKKSHYIKVLVEGGGLTQNLLNQSNVTDNRIFGLQVFQFWRFNPSFHYYLPLLKKNQSLAFRVNAGIASPYGKSSVLPYEKFFFVGGSNSIRAWQPRRLGPGATTPIVNADGSFDYRFEQPGEIILEANAEYRFPIFSFIRGALFIDTGNVWTIQNDENRPGSQFQFNSFLEQMAIGTGLGFRFNLPFLLFRLDFGIKVYDPARRGRDRWIIRRYDLLNPFKENLTLLNIGIGYPF